MTQEDKELLLRDLCGRLPYGVKVKITSRESKNRTVHLTADNICHITNDWWSECKPYLFPMTSMTEEQKEEFDGLYTYDALIVEPQWELIDWLNKNHFDYRGLIERGLAIDATNLNVY